MQGSGGVLHVAFNPATLQVIHLNRGLMGLLPANPTIICLNYLLRVPLLWIISCLCLRHSLSALRPQPAINWDDMRWKRPASDSTRWNAVMDTGQYGFYYINHPVIYMARSQQRRGYKINPRGSTLTSNASTRRIPAHCGRGSRSSAHRQVISHY